MDGRLDYAYIYGIETNGGGMIVWFTGQPGSGKTTLADALQAEVLTYRVDGDDLRELLPNPGYGEAGRRQNIDRAQAIAAFISGEMGYDVAVSLIAPYRDQREAFKEKHDVLEVYLTCDEIRGREHYFVEDYEPPLENFIHIDTGEVSIDEAVRIVSGAVSAFSQRTRLADTAEAR